MTRAIGIGLLATAALALVAHAADNGVPRPEGFGITAPDRFPRACVDCHINMPGMDVRLSTAMSQWFMKVDPAVVEKVKPIMPQSVTLTGRHPRLTEAAYRNVPGVCTGCHSGASPSIPPFGALLHTIHLTGNSHYLELFRGDCVNCHKLNTTTGRWSIPSGPEKP